MNLDFLNNPDFYACVLWFFAFGLVALFMGWGVRYVTSLFIKIFNKA